MAAAGGEPLAGRTLVITRPAAQAGRLARLIREQGARAIVFPVIEIRDVEDPALVRVIIDRLAEFDLAIFVSPSAVEKAMTLIGERGALPSHLRLAVVGEGSARALRRHTVAPVLVPGSRFDSEGLLELPALQALAGKRVVIFRGEGGRAALGDTLRARGAHVEYATCYRRATPEADVGPLLATWSQGGIDALIVTSSDGLRNLKDMLGPPGRRFLCETPVFVPHSRIAQTGRELGLTQVIEAAPGDEAMVARICRHFDAVC